MTMTDGHVPKERWARIDELFHAALERPVEQRSEFLASRCGGDTTLLRDVERLVDADATDATGLSDGPVVEGFSASALVDVDSDQHANERLGSYRLLKHIGSGGMGTVWLAERDDETFTKQVAIKLIKRGMDTDDILRRFRNERQVLARLEHPNIARLIDGGASEGGLPFLVMEYVDGVPIDRYCEQHATGINGRLELFRTVCSAVQYAHQNLVIHRDLKPSNILVTSDATAKLLDFGIAKVIHPEGLDTTGQQTNRDQRLITPRYASPEQTRGEAVTTASDVYSLGVILYELLTGRSPYPATDSRKTLEQLICDHEPEKPSTAVKRDTKSRHAVADRNDLVTQDASSTDRHRPSPTALLPSDLDWVVLKALRKNPQDRYATVEQLSDDIQRFLQDRPVQARPPSLPYQLRKLVKRNRLACAFAATVMALVAGFGVRLAVERGAALDARDHEAAARASAEQIGRFLQDMLGSINPEVAKGRDITLLRELLDHASQRIDAELADNPEVAASLHGTVGFTYFRIGLYDQADGHLRSALSLRQQIHGKTHADTLHSMNQLGELFSQMGRYDDAERLFDEVLFVRRRTLGNDDPLTLSVWGNLGWLYIYQGRFGEAKSAFEQVLEAMRRVLGNEHRETLLSMHALASVYRCSGRYEEAEKQFDIVAKVAGRVLGEDHPDVLRVLNDFALLYSNQGRYAEGASLIERVLATQRRILGNHHPDTLGSINNLALNYLQQRRFEESERLHLESCTPHRNTLGDNHPNTLMAINNLGFLYWKQTRFDEAAPLFEEALEKRRRVLGPDHPDTLVSMNNLATLYWAQKLYGKAEPLLVETLDMKRRKLGDEHPTTLRSLNNLAALYKTQERYEEAQPLFLQALDARQRVLGAEHPNTLFSRNALALLYNYMKRFDEAYELSTRTLEICRRTLGEDNVETQYTIFVMARSSLGLERFDDAERLAVPYYERCLANKGATHADTMDAAKLIADIYDAWGRAEDAAAWRSKSEPQDAQSAGN